MLQPHSCIDGARGGCDEQNFVFGRYFYPTGLGVGIMIAAADESLSLYSTRASGCGLETLVGLFCGMAAMFCCIAGVGWRRTFREGLRWQVGT